jgi:hypothetical protein
MSLLTAQQRHFSGMATAAGHVKDQAGSRQLGQLTLAGWECIALRFAGLRQGRRTLTPAGR